VGNYCYVAVCSAALGASAPTEGGEGRGHIVAAAHLQLITNFFFNLGIYSRGGLKIDENKLLLLCVQALS